MELRSIPTPGPRELLVRVLSVGVCGSDVHYYRHGHIGDYVMDAPLVLGHEVSGVVVDRGDDAHRLPVGQRVAIEPGVPCGSCRECRTGHYNLCRSLTFYAHPPTDGAFQDYVVIDEDFAFGLPDSVSDDAGALIEPLSVGLWACRKAGVTVGQDVIITGAGPIGLLALQAALARGARSVTVTDVNQHRLNIAERLGGEPFNSSQERPGDNAPTADVLLECSGNEKATNQGIRSLRAAGTGVLIGMGPSDTMRLPIQVIQERELVVTGSFRYASTYPEAIALLESGKVNPESIITGRFTLEQTADALAASATDPASIKPIVSVSDTEH